MKIKPAHLRIGNIVLVNSKEVTVQSLGEDYINASFFEGGYGDGGSLTLEYSERNNDTLEGVIITEEYLLKLGGQRSDFGWYLSAEFKLYNPLTKSNLPFRKYYGFMYKDNFVTYLAIRHIHELQNIYFALTGKELNLNTYEVKT